MGAALATEFRSPSRSNVCFSWLAQRIMNKDNGFDSIAAVSEIANSKRFKKPVIVELGPGSGFSLRTMFDKESPLQPSRVYAIEISEVFRQQLMEDEKLATHIESGKLSIHSDDAINLKFIPDNSVDLVFGFNVVYFLFPLDVYLKELNRILKPSGELQFCVKEEAKYMDKNIYENTDWDACLEKMKNNGFVDVEKTEVRFKYDGPISYSTLIGKKKSS